MKTAAVDFSHVSVAHWSMHDRLENWARWARGSAKRGMDSSPMFDMARSTARARDHSDYGAGTAVPVDKTDAAKVHVGVQALPDKHRRAIQWLYLAPRNPSVKAAELGLSKQGLADMIHDGRQMLINRRV